jgi:hypothetical protein
MDSTSRRRRRRLSPRTQYAALTTVFPDQHWLEKGGKRFQYITGGECASRLNDVLGVDGWSFAIREQGQITDDVWVRGRLTLHFPGRTVIREQVGASTLQRGMAPGDSIKSAATDALKKAATLAGVALYLYDDDAVRDAAWATEEEPAARPAGGAPPRRQKPASAPTATAQPPASGAPVTDREREAAVKGAQSVYTWAGKYQGLKKPRIMEILGLEPDDHLHMFMLHHGYTATHVIGALQQQADLGRIDWATVVQEAGGLRRVK